MCIRDRAERGDGKTFVVVSNGQAASDSHCRRNGGHAAPALGAYSTVPDNFCDEARADATRLRPAGRQVVGWPAERAFGNFSVGRNVARRPSELRRSGTSPSERPRAGVAANLRRSASPLLPLSLALIANRIRPNAATATYTRRVVSHFDEIGASSRRAAPRTFDAHLGLG